jgi:hypothetical protein
MYTDVYPDSPIIANLSGNFDSVINVGDTFKITIKIPDTINTNYGLLKLKSVNCGSFHFIKYTGTSTYWDSLTGSDLRLKLVVLKGLGPTPQQNFQHMGWDASGNYEALLEAIEENAFRKDNGRLLVGYTGWGEGQLEEELEREDWMIYNGPIENILSLEVDVMWKTLLQNMGPYYKMVSNFPTDPNLN